MITNYRLGLFLFFFLSTGCVGTVGFRSEARDDFGILVMAHGGTDEWNQTVLDVVTPLRRDYRLEVAFGMADATSIQEGVRRLEARGVKNIGVVRLFVSGESWFKRTEQILGLHKGAPLKSDIAKCDHHEPPGTRVHTPGEHPSSRETSSAVDIRADSLGGRNSRVHEMAFWRIETGASFALSREGLSDAREMETVLVDRAGVLSREPEIEDVLILAHGPEDDAENKRWIAKIDALADAVRKSIPFRRVEVQTLREDWPEKRRIAEEQIRAYVERAVDEDGWAVVIPFRVQGFGPYAEVLKHLYYVSDGLGLAPHAAVTQWIERQAESLRSGPFRIPLD